MPYEGERPLTPIELQARGLTPPGPLSPPIDPSTPQVNEQAIKDKGVEISGQASQGQLQSQKPYMNPFPPFPWLKQNLREATPGLAATAAGIGANFLPGASKPILGPLMRSAASGAAMGGTSKAMGGEFTGPAIMGGLTQGAAELPFMAGRQMYNQKAAPGMLAAQAEKGKFNEAMAEAITGAEKAGHGEQMAQLQQKFKADQLAAKGEFAAGKVATEKTNQERMAHFAEQGATHVADEFGKMVPAWTDIPANTKGLMEMVYGKGQERLSASFDRALKQAVAEGKGKQVNIPLADAESLGFKAEGAPQFPFPKHAAQVFGGANRGGIQEAVTPSTMPVDAGELASKITGTWKNDPGRYRRVFKALDEAGVGNEQARTEYRSGQALISFLDKSKALEGGTFHPERVQQGLTTLKKVDELRKRGMGDVFRGPLSEAVNAPKPEMQQAPPLRQVPQPQEIPAPMPTSPPKLPDLGITQRKMGPWERRILGAGVGEGVGFATGHPGMGWAAGGMLGDLAIPKTMYGNVPMGPLGRRVTTGGPSIAAEIIRLMQGGTQEDKKND